VSTTEVKQCALFDVEGRQGSYGRKHSLGAIGRIYLCVGTDEDYFHFQQHDKYPLSQTNPRDAVCHTQLVVNKGGWMRSVMN